MNKKVADKTNEMKKEKNGVMPLVSDYSSRTEWETACWRKLLQSKELLRLLVTSHERHNLVMRAAALDRLIAGKSYKQIGRELWLSPQTISGIKKALKEKSYQSYQSYQSYLERSKKERKKRKYSFNSLPAKARSRGRPHRTKYGTIYLPF
ncbi:MAG: hypothetical protein V1696_00870 [Candidatus Jorgensenbacteria bacterium]